MGVVGGSAFHLLKGLYNFPKGERLIEGSQAVGMNAPRIVQQEQRFWRALILQIHHRSSTNKIKRDIRSLGHRPLKGMASRAVQFLLRSAPPSSASQDLFFRRCTIPKVVVTAKRYYGVKSSLEPPDIKQLAETARISLTPQEVEEFAPKIQQVVEWFGQLQPVDLQSVEPALRADTEGDNLRNDAPEIFNNRDAMITAVPTYEDSYIKVPKVLNKE